jgi:hypothetical protein
MALHISRQFRTMNTAKFARAMSSWQLTKSEQSSQMLFSLAQQSDLQD